MSRIVLLWGILCIGAVLLACSPQSVPVEKLSQEPLARESKTPEGEEWRMAWERLQKEAKKEGKLVIVSTQDPETRQMLGDIFSNKFGLNIEFMTGRGGEISQKLMMERRAGLYLADVYVGGNTTILNVIKPNNMLNSLEPLLILPEVLESRLWFGGRLPVLDKDRFVIASMAFPTHPISINTNFVKPEDIGSYADLLNPRWKGRIIFQDPTTAGKGQGWFQMVGGEIMGMDFMRKLAQQEPLLIRDQRLMWEWLIRGKYSISLAHPTGMKEFEEGGFPIQHITPREGDWLMSASSNVAVFNQAPHPNAAQLFINWFLSREGQILYVKSTGGQYQSAREDVPLELTSPEGRRDPKITYRLTTEEILLKRPEYARLAEEIFGQLLK